MKRALITGITGQDGSYLAEFLLSRGYKVYGFSSKNESRQNLRGFSEKIEFIDADLRNQESLNAAIRQSMPDEVYHLAALSFVGDSWKKPVLVGDVNSLGTTRLLESIRLIKPDARIYNASTSEMFGLSSEIKKEESAFHPKSPYAISKCFSHWMAINYRESYGMYVCCGILFNHESPRRGKNFVTKKIVKAAIDIKNGNLDCLYLGNIYSERDWGYAKDYVEAMWLMLQQDKPDDYIISTAEVHTVREFLEKAFEFAGIKIKSNGKKNIDEEFIRSDTGATVVKISKEFFRPVELTALTGSNEKARSKLNWSPTVKFDELIKIMVKHELNEDQ